MATITAVQESFGLDLSEHLSEVVKDIITELNKVRATFIIDIKVFDGIDGKFVLLRCIIPTDKSLDDVLAESEDGSGSGNPPTIGCLITVTDSSLTCDVKVDEFEAAVRAAADKHGEKDCHNEQTVRG